MMRFDFFLAHAGPDVRSAQKLYEHLFSAGARVFLDSKSLSPGDAWDDVLPSAQSDSDITVVLISKRTEVAFYQREEVAAAIAHSRRAGVNHRVVPVYLEPVDDVPYGLRRLHSLRAYGAAGLRRCSKQLLELLGSQSTGRDP